MEFDAKANAGGQMLAIITRFTDDELDQYAGAIKDFLLRRMVDTLYAELLPVMREKVGAALDAAQIAKCIEGELSQAIHEALH